MATGDIEREWIDRFQENLSIIRKVAGWTTQELADELGVARQTVSNLETGKSPMTKLQYLALRTVLNAEIARRKDQDLAKVIKTLVDDPFDLSLDISSITDCTDKADSSQGKPADTGKGSAKTKRPLSIAMQVLAIITGALASGTAAGLIAFFSLPGGKNAKS